MNNKKSTALRNMIASTLKDAANDPAPVIITGAGITPPQALEKSVPELKAPPSSNVVPLHTLEETISTENAATEPITYNDPSQTRESRVKSQENTSLEQVKTSHPFLPPTTPPQKPQTPPAPYIPQKLAKAPSWQKANVTLEPEDMRILDHSDAQARSYGFRIRKGGNPSLFIRAGLRLLNDLLEKDPEMWIKRIAETLPISD